MDDAPKFWLFRRWDGSAGNVPDIDYSGPASGSWVSRWLGGIAVPLGLAAWGISGIAARATVAPAGGRFAHGSLRLIGDNAVIFGCMLLCAALFLHSHHWWTTFPRALPFAHVGKIVTLIGFVCMLFWLLFRLWWAWF